MDYSSDSAEMEWLKKYTFEGMDTSPGKAILDDLLASFPHDGGTLYRGLNFESKAHFDDFVRATENFTRLEAGGVTSWTRAQGTADQFARTRPTYYLNRELMQAEAKKSRENDYMIGHAGVVIAIEVATGIGIDVSKTKHVKEDEVILPPGSYAIKLQKISRPFIDSISEENFEREFLSIQSKDSKGDDSLKFHHILNRFEDFTDSMKGHLFSLIERSTTDIEVHVSMDTTSDSISGRHRNKVPSLYIGWSIPSEFFDHSEKFLPSDSKKILRKIDIAAAEIDRKFSDLTRDFNWDEQHFYLQIDPSVIQAATKQLIQPEFIDTINNGISRFYRNINSMEKVDEINEMPPSQKNEAIRATGRMMAHALSQLIRVKTNAKTSLDCAQRAKEFVDKEVRREKKVSFRQ